MDFEFLIGQPHYYAQRLLIRLWLVGAHAKQPAFA